MLGSGSGGRLNNARTPAWIVSEAAIKAANAAPLFDCGEEGAGLACAPIAIAGARCAAALGGRTNGTTLAARRPGGSAAGAAPRSLGRMSRFTLTPLRFAEQCTSTRRGGAIASRALVAGRQTRPFPA
jgi:hypothetical protein